MNPGLLNFFVICSNLSILDGNRCRHSLTEEYRPQVRSVASLAMLERTDMINLEVAGPVLFHAKIIQLFLPFFQQFEESTTCPWKSLIQFHFLGNIVKSHGQFVHDIVKDFYVVRIEALKMAHDF